MASATAANLVPMSSEPTVERVPTNLTKTLTPHPGSQHNAEAWKSRAGP